MKRRESFKVILVGTVAGATLASAAGCKTEPAIEEAAQATNNKLYGRLPAEIEHDEKINAEIFLNEHELNTIAVLCDIILPATATAGSATDAGVPDFIDFIVKGYSQDINSRYEGD